MAGITQRRVTQGTTTPKMPSERMWGKTAGSAPGVPNGPVRGATIESVSKTAFPGNFGDQSFSAVTL